MTNRQNPYFQAISTPFSTLKTGNSNVNVTILGIENGRHGVPKGLYALIYLLKLEFQNS